MSFDLTIILITLTILIIFSHHSLIGVFFAILAIGSGACFTIASAITEKHSARTVADWNTAGFAAATAFAITPITLTNIVKVILGRARVIRTDRRKRFLVFYVVFLGLILGGSLWLRFGK
jgi:hypothetical protein